MSEMEVPEDYEVLVVPLNENYTDKIIVVDANIIVVAQCPIAVTAKINDRSKTGFNLQLIRTIRMKVKRFYITTTTTDSEDLILFVSKKVEVEAAPASGRVQLVDSTDTIYDASKNRESDILNNSSNINNGAQEDSGEITTTGYNEIAGWVFADRALTVYIYGVRAASGTKRQLDSVAIAASTGTGFVVPVVGGIMKVEIDNSSGGNTTTCEKHIFLRSHGVG